MERFLGLTFTSRGRLGMFSHPACAWWIFFVSLCCPQDFTGSEILSCFHSSRVGLNLQRLRAPTGGRLTKTRLIGVSSRQAVESCPSAYSVEDPPRAESAESVCRLTTNVPKFVCLTAAMEERIQVLCCVVSNS